MKKTIALKGLGCILIVNLVCSFLAGCGAEQGSVTDDPASSSVTSGEGQGSITGGSADSSGSSGEGQVNIMDNPAYSPLGRQVLTAVVVEPLRDTLDRILAFNADNPSYFIEIKSYGVGLGTEAAVNLETQLSLEILSGKGPDLVIWDRDLYTPSLASEKLMENLYDFMDADPDFHREDYYENILQAFEINGGLYTLPASFTVETGCVKAEELGSDRDVTESWELGEMVEAYEHSPHAERFSKNFTREFQLRFICEDCMGNFVDWSSGECHFDTPEFVELLEFCKTFPEELMYPEDYHVLEFLRSGKIFWQPVRLVEPWDVAYKRTECGGALLWPGHPVADGEQKTGGGVASPYGECFSICRNSSNREAAWECIKSWLTADMQRGVKGIPLLRSVSEERIQDALTLEYETVDGIKQEKIKYDIGVCISEAEVVRIELSCITEEDAEIYRSIIENTYRSSGKDTGILDIIMEEAGAYFEKGKDAATVADIIQNRVSVYVSERM